MSETLRLCLCFPWNHELFRANLNAKRNEKRKEIELLRTYNWLISAGFPQYVQLHRDNQGLINTSQVEQENFLLEKFMMEALLKRINILNQHTKTKFSDSTDIQILTGNSDDFNFSLSASWSLDRSISKWINLNNGLERSCDEDESTLRGKAGSERCTCHGEAINQSPASHSPFAGSSPARKPKKKKNEGKKKNKSLRVEEDAASSDNTFPTPVNSSLNSSDFKANQNSSNNVDASEDQEKGGTLFFCGSVRGDQEANLQSRKSSLQTELNRSSHLRQQYKSLKNFFKSVGDRISSAKSSKVPRYCNECNGGNEPTRLANSFSSNSRRASKSATCSDSFLMLDSGCLPDIKIFGSRENTHKRCKSENCLTCNSRRRSWFNVRRSGREGRPPDAPRSASLHRRSVTPTSSRHERMNNTSINNKTLLSLEMPRRRYSNSTSNSPKILTESTKLSPFRKMITVPDKMERLSGDNSSLENSIPLYFNSSNSAHRNRRFLTGDGKSNTDDSSYYDCFGGSSNCISDDHSGALAIDEKTDRFGSSSFAGCNGSQSEESRKSSYQSLETSKNFRQKELDSILRELYNKINTLDKIRFDVERESANIDGQPCPHSNSSNASDQLEEDLIFRTFSMEKAKFFNVDQTCLIKTAKACDKCMRQLTNLKSTAETREELESKERKMSLNSGQKKDRQTDQHGPGDDKRPTIIKTDLSLLTASELFVLRKVSLIHLTSITDKYLLSNVDNLLAPKPDSKLSERRDSAWGSSEKKEKLFGSSLLDVVSNFGQPLPGPIGRALAFLSFVGGDAVGIFRRPGVKSRIAEIRAQLDDDPDAVDFHSQSVYDVADLVKLYFRELPGSLFTKEYSQLLINIFSYVPQDLRLPALRDIMCLLPDENRVVLRHLLFFLHNLSTFSNTNQMDINNMATCFAPSLFHSTNQQGAPVDDSFGGQGCWDRNGSANGKKGQTMPLHHSHPHSTMHRNVHQTSSNSADYIREATEMKDHKATKECLSCLIANAHLVFQVSNEMSQAASNFASSRLIESNFSAMLDNRENCLSAFLKESISSTIHDVDNNLSGWLPITSRSLDIEVYFKPGHTLNQAKESHLLGTFVASTFIPVQPKEAMNKIACQREHWDDSLLSWSILEKVEGINVNESELRADIQAGISRMAKNSDIPTIIEENVGEFSGKFDWSGILGFNSYSGDVVHYTVSFAPGSDLEYCEMRLWQSSNSASVLLSTSVNHPSIPPSNDIRCHVMDCRYVVVSVNNVTSKVYYFSQVDLKGHLPSWYEKVYGNLCANHLKKLLASFDECL